MKFNKCVKNKKKKMQSNGKIFKICVMLIFFNESFNLNNQVYSQILSKL